MSGVLFVDGQLVAVDYLRAALAARAEPYAADVLVSTRLPDGATPPRHVQIRRVGGTPLHEVADSPRLQATVRLHTGAVTDEKSRTDLGMLVWSLLLNMANRQIGAVTCYRATSFSGPVAAPDPADPTREVVFCTVDVAMRGTAL